MKKQIFIFLLLHNFFITFGQELYSYQFEKIISIDTIHKNEVVNNLLSDIELFNNKYFISYYRNDRIPFFYIKENDFCLALNLDFSDETNYNIIGLSDNQEFIYINGEGNHSARQTEVGYKNLYIINLKNFTFLNVQYYSSLVYWEPDETDFNSTKEFVINSSKIVFNKNGITVLNQILNINDDSKVDYDVIQSGEYEFDKLQLKKIKFYDEKSMSFKPIKYIGDMAIGMTINDLKLVYPYVSFIEKENIYKTCTDENELGFEIWDGNELLGYANKNSIENRITNLKVISSIFKFGKINTNSTASEVLKYYSKSSVRLDLISDWEHIYIKELDIELVFKTNNNNRIAKYKNEDFIKLINGKVKVDFIEVN